MLVDLVPNHTSSEHAWFRAALAAGPGQRRSASATSSATAGARTASSRPNNWPSVFGGRGWTRVTEADGTPGPVVPAHLRRHPARPELGAPRGASPSSTTSCGSGATAASTASGSTSPTAWSSARGCPTGTARSGSTTRSTPSRPDRRGARRGAAALHRRRRARPHRHRCGADVGPGRRARDLPRLAHGCSTSYGLPDRILCAEAWVQPGAPARRATCAPTRCTRRSTSTSSTPTGTPPRCARSSRPRCAPTTSVGAPTTWVLSNHDVVRHASRLGLDQALPRPNGIRADDPQPDAVLGLRRARAATALMLALPGGAYVYQGEELGLPEHTDHARRVPPGPDLPPHRRRGHRPRRLPGADAVGQGRAEQRLRPGRHPVAAAARRLRRPRGRPAGGRRRLDPRAVPRACSSTAAGTGSGTAAWPGTRWRPTPSSPCATPPATASAPCSW